MFLCGNYQLHVVFFTMLNKHRAMRAIKYQLDSTYNKDDTYV